MTFSASYAAHVKTIDQKQIFKDDHPSPCNGRDDRFEFLSRTMKLTSILLLIACLQVNATGFGQGTVTISVKNVAVTEVFKEIEKQTPFRFLYRDELVKKAGLVTLSVRDASVQDVLNRCFDKKPLDYKIFRETIVISEKSGAVSNGGTGMMEQVVNTIDVTGRVLNEQGKPVEGVTVTIKNSDKSTITNANGEFFLSSVDQDAVLVFTSVNMETFELRVSGKTELVVSLKAKVSELGGVEVVVNTGYEKIPKERATGSFGFVNNEQINRKTGVDILSRLENVTTGVQFDRRSLQPNQGTVSADKIVIRGISTLTDDMKTPLVIVDNFPFEGNINNINPNDVESITILKDAAAASIWGARAGNGVIVITTKRGQYNQQFKLALNSNLQLTQKPDLFAYPYMSSSDFVDFEKYLFDEGFYNTALANPRFAPVSPVVEILELERNGSLSPTDAATELNRLRQVNVRNDFEKYIYRNGVNQQYSVNLSGGTQRARYMFSGGYDRSLSTLKGNDYHRVTFRSATNFVPINRMEINVGIAYSSSVSKNNSMGDLGSSAYSSSSIALSPYALLADEYGNPLPIAKDYRLGFSDSAGGGQLLDWTFRPLQELNSNDNRERMSDLLFSLGIQYKLTSFLSLNINYQFERMNTEARNLYSTETYYARNIINRFTQVGPSGLKRNVPNGAIYDFDHGEMNSHIGRAQVNINKDWGTEHRISGIVGGEIKEKTTALQTQRIYGFDPNSYTNASIDYVSMFPLYGNLGSDRIIDRNGQFLRTDHFVSLYSNLAYTYRDRYVVSGSVRRDAANIFGIKSNNRWKPLWTAGLAWNVSKESFYSSRLFPYLRLRATFGYQGNVNNSISPNTLISYSSNNNIANLPWAFITNAANPQLTWESIGQLNIGIDFKIGQRISGSMEAYRKQSKNLLYNKPIDPTTGVLSVKSNYANMTAKGLEFSLSSQNTNGIFIWLTEFGITFNRNTVVDYDSTLDKSLSTASVTERNGLNIVGLRGKSPYPILSYDFAGLDATGNPLGYLGKAISTNYQAILNERFDTTGHVIYHGSAVPTVFGFFNNIFRVKGFTLTISIGYQLGYYFKKNAIAYYPMAFGSRQHADYANRWKQAGDEQTTNIPSLVYPFDEYRDRFYAASSVNVLRGDNMRLQNIRLSYIMNSQKVGKLPFTSIEIYGNAQNLGLLWRANDEGLDPDYNIGNALFPVPKVFSAGLQMTF